MTRHTIKVFSWTKGGGYNKTYPDSQTAVITDDDDKFEGYKDSNETIRIDGGPEIASSSYAFTIKCNYTDIVGKEDVGDFNFFYADGDWYFSPEKGSSFSEGAKLGYYKSHSYDWNYDDVACFCKGTLIETDHGQKPIERLKTGDRIVTIDGGHAILGLCLQRHVSTREMDHNPKLRPVRIAAGAMGPLVPRQDLYVSRQHRMALRSGIAERMFGKTDVLVSAIKLTELPGIKVASDWRSATYYHLVFDAHQIIFANGAPSESFYLTSRSVALLDPEARVELETLFADTLAGCFHRHPASFIPENRRQKKLVERHLKNAKPLLSELCV